MSIYASVNVNCNLNCLDQHSRCALFMVDMCFGFLALLAHVVGLLVIMLQVGLILQSMGFSNSTMIYVAGGAIFREETFMQMLRSKFRHLETRSSIVTTVDGLVDINTSGKTLLGAAVDYMVCLMADIFMPTYEDFGISLIGHRLYNGFRTSIQLNLKVLGPRNPRNFETNLRWLFQGSQFGDLHNRGARESFYTNPWPQCFCKKDSKSQDERCFRSKMLELFSWELSEDSGKINGSLI